MRLFFKHFFPPGNEAMEQGAYFIHENHGFVCSFVQGNASHKYNEC